MLKIYFGNMENSPKPVVFNPPPYFDSWCKNEWLESDFAKEVVSKIDKSELVGPHLVISPVFGAIPPRSISGGAKTLILIMFDDTHIFNATACGDNCAKLLLDIGKTKDIIINLHYIMNFGNEFEIEILNTGTIVKDFDNYFDEAYHALRG